MKNAVQVNHFHLESHLCFISIFTSKPFKFDFVVNTLVSLNMVVALVVAFVLDNTVPGSRQERGVYIWSDFNSPNMSPSSLEPYTLPEKIGRYFRWAKWVGS